MWNGADEDVRAIVDMLVGESILVSENGVEHEIVFGSIELERWIKLVFFLLLLLFKVVNCEDFVGRLQVDVDHLLVVPLQGLLDIQVIIRIIIGKSEVSLAALVVAFITSVPFDRVTLSTNKIIRISDGRGQELFRFTGLLRIKGIRSCDLGNNAHDRL